MKRIALVVVIVVVAVAAGYYFLMKPAAPLADDKIVVDAPLPGATVTSPFTVRGKARGTWFFEASFPVILTDSAGHILAQAPAHAESDWMTTDFVPFSVTLTFTTPTTATGTLTLKKDNPSGLPQNDDSRTINVKFK